MCFYCNICSTYSVSRLFLSPCTTAFLSRDASIKRCFCRQAVCVSVCLSRSYILSKRINISSKFIHRRVAPPFQLFHTKPNSNIPTGSPLECRWGRLKSRFSTNISLCDLHLLHPGLYFAVSDWLSVYCGYWTTKRDALYTVTVVRDCVQRESDRTSAFSRYTQSRSSVNRVYDSKARRYGENNRTESNCAYWQI